MSFITKNINSNIIRGKNEKIFSYKDWLKFISKLYKKDKIDDDQFIELLAYATSSYIEYAIEDRITEVINRKLENQLYLFLENR